MNRSTKMGPHLLYSWETARADGENWKLLGPSFTELEVIVPGMVVNWLLTLPNLCFVANMTSVLSSVV